MRRQVLLGAGLENQVTLQWPLAKLPGEPLAHPLLQSRWETARDVNQMAWPWPSIELPGEEYHRVLQLPKEVLLAALGPLAFVRGG